MENEALRDNLLFRAMEESELEDCLRALSARTKRYKKDALILHAGEKAEQMGIVLEGSVTVETNDIWGNCTILSHVGPGGYFAETYAYLTDAVMLVDVVANNVKRSFCVYEPIHRKRPLFRGLQAASAP